MNGRRMTDTVRGLECTILSPGLNSVLVWDAPLQTLSSLAASWGSMIEERDPLQRKTETIVVGPAETEESLWGRWGPGTGEETIRWIPGLLSKPESTIPIYVIADLATLELPARRALVTSVGQEVVHLERSGRSESWQPQGYWLAAARREEIGHVSPHLLDRFPVRLNLPCQPEENRLLALRQALTGNDTEVVPMEESIFRVPARGARPAISEAALDCVLELMKSMDAGAGMRRSLTLARFATSVAIVAGASEVNPEHVDEAARLIGLPARARPAEMPAPFDSTPSDPPGIKPVREDEPNPVPEQSRGDVATPTPNPRTEMVAVSQTVILPPESGPLSDGGVLKVPVAPPYLEDTVPIERESFSLRFATVPQGRKSVPRGRIIGSLPTSELRDIALTATLMEAAKFQAIRRKELGSDRRLRVDARDLRKNRRLPEPDHLLLLVIDYTAVSDMPWQPTLVPYLHEAYTNRAAIAVVQVGAQNAVDPLRATLVRARNLLSPAVALALSVGAGTATPLAHGLDIAASLLLSSLHRGRQSACNAHVIVVTDGRGNVPLTASLTGREPGRISREGIDDSLAVARRFREINRLNCVVVSPTLRVYRRLPEELAGAMNARIAYLPPHRTSTPASLAEEAEL